MRVLFLCGFHLQNLTELLIETLDIIPNQYINNNNKKSCTILMKLIMLNNGMFIKFV